MEYNIGDTYERLTVVGETKINKKNYYVCKCTCGNTHNLLKYKFGKVKSCGCVAMETRFIKTHGNSRHRLYRIWFGIKSRCYNQKIRNYQNYGGRGIHVCEEWLNSFDLFFKWAMDNGYSEELSIDRIDVNGNYEPSNCRWATKSEQQNNRRGNVYTIINGENKTLKQWSEISGISETHLRRRYERGVRGIDLLLPTKKAQKKSGVPLITWDKNIEQWRIGCKFNNKTYYVGYEKELDDAILRQVEFKNKLSTTNEEG